MDLKTMFTEITKDNEPFFKGEKKKFLIENFNAQNEDGDTVLHLCVKHQCKKMLNMFSDREFHGYRKYQKALFIQNKNGNTPLHLSIMNDFEIKPRIICSKDLFSDCDHIEFGSKKDIFLLQNEDGNHIVHLMCMQKPIDVYDLTNILNDDKQYMLVKNKDGNTPLHLACKYDTFNDVIKILEKDHVSLTPLFKIKNNDGKTLSEISSDINNDAMFKEIEMLFDEYIQGLKQKYKQEKCCSEEDKRMIFLWTPYIIKYIKSNPEFSLVTLSDIYMILIFIFYGLNYDEQYEDVLTTETLLMFTSSDDYDEEDDAFSEEKIKRGMVLKLFFELSSKDVVVDGYKLSSAIRRYCLGLPGGTRKRKKQSKSKMYRKRKVSYRKIEI